MTRLLTAVPHPSPSDVDPVTAMMKNPPPPVPPHKAKDADNDPSGIEFEQAEMGALQCWTRFINSRALYNTLAAILDGQQRVSIISWPTGSKDEQGEQIITDVDLEEVLKQYPEGKARDAAMKAMLGPLHNYACTEFIQWAAQTAKYLNIMVEMASNP